MSEVPNSDLTPQNPEQDAAIVSIGELLTEARELVIDGERDKAFEVVTRALKVDMNNIEALWMYAQLNSNQEKSISALRRLISIQPDHAKAKALLNKLTDVDLLDNTSTPRSTKKPDQSDIMAQMLKNQQMMLEQQNRQPVININNTATSHANVGMPLVMPGRNQTAYIIGLLIGIFLGTFGVAHFINGKVGSGIVNLLVGWFIWAPIAAVLVTATAGLGACLVIPIHIALAHSTANKGARTMMPMMMSG